MSLLLTLFAVTAAATAPPPPAATPAAAPPPVVVPVAKPRKPRNHQAIASAPNPALVEARTSTGKIVHYDCSKAGNKTKTACKK